MIRMILIFVVLVLAFISGIAVALHHFFGWKGLIAFPFILIALLWVGKVIVVSIFKKFALGLFSMKSAVLRGATMEVHSVVPTTKPEFAQQLEDAEDATDESEEGEEEEAEAEEPRDYFAVDMTITPGKKGRDGVWEPGEFILAGQKIKSLSELEESEIGNIEEVLVWNGSSFGPDDPGKYPGVQRLKVTFAVKPGVSKAWLHYYNEPIGEITLPAGKIINV